jgi:glyoxylase-like metal-dependent hydrolase (beta-lactamase superfamily II)
LAALLLTGAPGCTATPTQTAEQNAEQTAENLSAPSVPPPPPGFEVHLFIAGAGDSADSENTYLLVDSRTKTAVIIDPGGRSDDLETRVRTQGLRVAGILNTHGHYDHIGANAYYRDLYDVPVYADASETALYRTQVGVDPKNAPTRALPDGELRLGGLRIQVIRTPGHSAGSVCFLVGEMLFSGDTLFEDSIGRTDDFDAERLLLGSIQKRLLTLPAETRVYPGHGRATTIGAEKAHNPYLQQR